MKYNIYLLLFLGALLITCGTDDSYMPETDYKFPFELNTILDDNYYARESGYIKIKPEIAQLNKNISLDYTFSIEVLGDKILKENLEIIYDNRNITQGQDYSYNKEYSIFEFKPKEVGTYPIQITFENQYGYKVVHKESIEITQIDFSVQLNKDIIYPLINKHLRLDILALEEEEQASNITYNYNYDFAIQEQAQGVVVMVDGRQISAKENISYSSKEISFTFPKSGEYEIIFNVVSSQGKKVSKKEIIKVEDVLFDFEFTEQGKLNPNTNILFKLKTDNLTEDILQKYKLKIENLSTDYPSITYNSSLLNKDVFYNVVGEDLYISFSKTGEYSFNIILENQYGYEVKKEMYYNISYANFSIKTEDFPTKIFLNDDINYSLLPVMDEEDQGTNVDYTFKVKYPKGVVMEYEDRTLVSDTYVKYNSPKIKARFVEKGVQEIVYYFKNSQGLEVSVKEQIDIKVSNYEIDIETPKQILLGKKVSLAFEPKVLDNEQDKISYDFKILSDKDVGVFYNGYQIALDTYTKYQQNKLEFLFNQVGDYNLSFVFKNSQGIEITRKIVISVGYSTFEIKAENIPAKINLKERFSINLTPSLIEEALNTEGLSYDFKVQTSEGTTVYYNNYQMPVNTYQKYDQSKVDLIFTEKGQHEITFTFKNSQGLEVVRKIVFIVQMTEFKLDIKNVPKDILLNKDYDFTVLPTIKNEEDKDLKLDYSFKVQANKGVEISYNGYQMPLNTMQTYAEKDFNVRFTEPGQHEVTFTFKSSQGLEVVEKITFLVKLNEYSIEIENMPKSIYINTNTVVDVFPKSNTGQELTYQFKIDAPKSVEASYNGYQIPLNNYASYTSKSIDLKFTEPGQQEVNFTYKSSQGLEVSRKVVFVVLRAEYGLTFENVPKDILLNKDYDFAVLPTIKNVDDKDFKLDYSFKVQANKGVEISYNGYQMPLNTMQTYAEKDFNVRFTEPGQHEVTFTFKSSQGLEVVEKVTFNAKLSEYTIEVENMPKEIFLNTNTLIDVFPKSSTGEDLSYQVKVNAPASVEASYNGYQIPVNTYTTYASKSFGFKFTEPGQHEITFTFKSSQGLEVVKKVLFAIKSSTFEVVVDGVPQETSINKRLSVTVDPKVLENNQPNTTYEFKVQANSNTLVYYDGGYQMPMNTYQKYSSNKVEVEFKETGQHEVSFYLKNSQGIEVRKRVLFNVKDLNFDIDIQNLAETVLPKTQLPFKIKPVLTNETSGVKYTYKIKVDKPNVLIKNGSTSVIQEYDYEYKTEDFEFNFPGDGTYIVSVDMTNNFGGVTSKAIQVHVIGTDFDIALNEEQVIYVNKESPLDIKITSQSTATYKVKYSIQGGGGDVIDVKQNGAYVYADTFIEYKNVPFMITYPRAGQYVITITIEDNFGKVKDVKKQIVVVDNMFSVNITADKTQLSVGENTNVKFDVTKTPANQKVFLKIVNGGGDNVILKYGNNQVFFNQEFELTNQQLNILFNQKGTNNFTFEFRNETGKKETKTLSFNVSDLQYNTSISTRILDAKLLGYDRDYYLNPVNVEVAITSLANAQNLQIKFVSSDLITVNGLTANQYYTLNNFTDRYTFDFASNAYGNSRNLVDIVVLEPSGNEVKFQINLPVNQESAKLVLGNEHKQFVSYDWRTNSGGLNPRGYTLNRVIFDDLILEMSVNPVKVDLNVWLWSWREENLVKGLINDEGDGTYRIVFPNLDPDRSIGNTNDTRVEIELIVTDELGRISTIKWEESIKK